MVYVTSVKTPIGMAVLKANDEALFELDFNDEIVSINENEILKQAKIELGEYFAGERKDFTLPLDPQGTLFQKEVYKTLRGIEYGSSISYKEEAIRMGRQRAFRAVANANGKNPISIIIPCHRVIASDGKLGGYSGGLWRKEFLLKLEKVAFKI